MAMSSAPAVQRLYDVCKKVFTSTSVPSEAQVSNVRAVLDPIKPQDLGLTVADQQNRGDRGFGDDGQGNWRPILPRYAPPISYLHLYECELFSMGIFILPTSATIPLHNHPGMTVLSRLLYGNMHVRAYDWVDPHDERLNKNPKIAARQAKLVVDHVLGGDPNGTQPQRASSTEVLYPTSGGNIHAFTALTPCAVLDVLAPPYSPATGRHCTYYRATSNDGVAEPGLVEWLEEFHPPDDFVVQRGLYKGPRIIPSYT